MFAAARHVRKPSPGGGGGLGGGGGVSPLSMSFLLIHPVALIERQLAVAQRITKIGSWEWDVDMAS